MQRKMVVLTLLIIDEKDTSDKHILNEIWLELEGNVLDSSTSNGMSNQNLLSEHSALRK